MPPPGRRWTASGSRDRCRPEAYNQAMSDTADDDVKTHFKGPGQWRSQAAKLEGDETPEPDPQDDEAS